MRLTVGRRLTRKKEADMVRSRFESQSVTVNETENRE